MARFDAASVPFGEQSMVVLTDTVADRRVRIACHGAMLMAFEVATPQGMHDLADGYGEPAEVIEHTGSRFAVLVPFGGRVNDARYRFDGKAYDLQPGVTGAERSFRHGYARDLSFDIAEIAGDDDATAVLLSSVVTPKPGYPFKIELQVRFTLDAGGLSMETSMRNAGEQRAPCFFGWHPYFRVGTGHCNTWELQVPARTVIRADYRLIALPGAAAYVPLDEAPNQDFRQLRAIGDRVIDYGFTDLQADADGRIRTHLRDPESGLGIAVWQEHGVMHAFTGDTVSRPRQSVALEPMECMANAFNRDDCVDTIGLSPGETRRFRCGVEVSTP